MTLITRLTDNEDIDDFDEESGMIRGRFLDKIVDEASATKHFGEDYRHKLIGAPAMQAFLSPLFIAPAMPLGIDFNPFTIYPDCLYNNLVCNEVLDEVQMVVYRFELYCEMSDEVTYEWLNTQIDERLALRHIPLLPTHTGSFYFHAYHLDSFLDFAFKMKDGHHIFGKDDRFRDLDLWYE